MAGGAGQARRKRADNAIRPVSDSRSSRPRPSTGWVGFRGLARATGRRPRPRGRHGTTPGARSWPHATHPTARRCCWLPGWGDAGPAGDGDGDAGGGRRRSFGGRRAATDGRTAVAVARRQVPMTATPTVTAGNRRGCREQEPRSGGAVPHAGS